MMDRSGDRGPEPVPRKGRARKRILIGCIVIASVAIAAYATRAPVGPLPTGSYQLRYDRAVWIDPHASDYVEDDLTPRQKMLGDVIQMLPGRDRAELEQILGPSLQTPYFKDTGRSLIYCLGPERGYMGIDSEWLLIWLDERDRFQRFAIACD